MSLESGPNNQNVQRPQEEISLNVDPHTGKHWYLDKNRRVVELTDEHDIERDRQQREPESEPAPGHAKYSSGISMAEMPAAPGEIVPIPIEPQQEGENQAPINFKMHYSHSGTLKGYRRILPDGTYEKNPDGTNTLFTEDEMNEERAKAANARTQTEKKEPSSADVHASAQSGAEKRKDRSSISVEERLGIDHGNTVGILENDIDPNLFQKYPDDGSPSAGQFWHPNRVGYTYTADEVGSIQRYYAEQRRRAARQGGTGAQEQRAGGSGHQAPPPWRRGPGPALTDAERADNSYVTGTSIEPPLVTPGTPVQQGIDMPALPGFYRAQDKAAIVNRVFAGAPPTLDVILQNPKTQELFGEFLKISNRSDLIGKFATNAAAMSLEDQEKMHTLRLEFGNRLALAEEAAAYLTQEDVTMMLKNPNFGLFADTLRPERAMKVIQERGIPLLFMRENHTAINKIILAQRSLQGIRSGPRQKYYQNLRERVMRRAGTNAAPEHLDPNVMQHVLGKSMLEWITFRGPNDRHRDTLNSITHNIALVSNILSSSISADPKVLLGAAREAQTGNQMPGIGAVESSYSEMKKAEGSYKLSEEKRAFGAFKDRLRQRGIDTNSLSAVDETNYFSDFQREREAVHGRGERRRGWFSTLLDAFFSALFANNRNEFKFKEA